jgi:hypothetical protein
MLGNDGGQLHASLLQDLGVLFVGLSVGLGNLESLSVVFLLRRKLDGFGPGKGAYKDLIE